MKKNEININSKEVIQACITLIGYCLSSEATGADFEIGTPKGTAHCSFDFIIDLEEDD